jgi:hypothetical protein
VKTEEVVTLRSVLRLAKSVSWQAVVIAGVLLWFSLQLHSIRYTSATIDEPDHIDFGLRLLRGTADTASMQRMPITVLNALPLYIKHQDARLLDQAEPGNWFAARIPTLIMGAGLLLVIFFFSRSLFGLAGGLVSFWAAVLSPNLAAHSGLATTDVPCAFMMLVSLWCLLRYFNRETIPSWLIVSLVIGIAQLTKNTALILIPLGLGGLIFIEVRRCLKIKDRLGRLTLRLAARTALFGCILLICINAGYGFHRTMEPLSRYIKPVQENMDIRPATLGAAAKIARPFLSTPVPLPYVFIETILIGAKANRTFSGHGAIYLMGKLRQEGFWYYFPVILLLKEPLALIVMSFLACVLVFQNRHYQGIFLVGFAGLLVTWFTLGCTAQLGIRYMLPITSLLLVAMGILPKALVGSPRFSAGFFLSAFVWLALSMLSYYPHLLSYMNEIAWDRDKLYMYCADSNLDWKQDYWYLKRYLEKHPGATVNPDKPVRGEVIVSINGFLGITGFRETYEWLRDHHKPVGRIAYSWLIFSIP